MSNGAADERRSPRPVKIDGVGGPFQGTTLSEQDVGSILVCENAYGAGSVLAEHGHEQAFLSLTLAGGYVERHGARNVEYGVGSIAYHPPGEEHAVAIGLAEVRCLNIEVREAWLARRRPRRAFVRAVGGPLAWIARGLLDDEPLAAESAVVQMLDILDATEAPTADRLPPPWLDRAEEILEAEYRAPLTLAGLAARVGVHPVHLSRTWLRFRRSSVGDALRRRRIAEARRRIAAGPVRLVDLALEIGFADQAQFTRAFRRVTGITPRAFRNAMR
jgi:AraC family transcriptional regulator